MLIGCPRTRLVRTAWFYCRTEYFSKRTWRRRFNRRCLYYWPTVAIILSTADATGTINCCTNCIREIVGNRDVSDVEGGVLDNIRYIGVSYSFVKTQSLVLWLTRASKRVEEADATIMAVEKLCQLLFQFLFSISRLLFVFG